MFEIQCFWNKSDNNVVNKELTPVITLSGSLRNEAEVVDPTILIEVDDPNKFNYIYIPAFKRYYYIKDRTSVRTGIVEIAAHCDVLMTYKAQFLTLPAVINRNTHDYNVYLPDDQFTALGYERVQVRAFPNSMTADKEMIFICAD